MKKFYHHWGVLSALLVSIFVVIGLRMLNLEDSIFTRQCMGLCELTGKLFMNALKMLVVPLITSSLICGIMSFGSQSEFRRLGLKTFLFYFLTCFVAVILGLWVTNVLKPGMTHPDLAAKILGQANILPSDFVSINKIETAKFSNFILRLLPQNILSAAADNTQILGLIVFSLLFGFFIGRLPDDLRKVQWKLWEGIQQIVRNITHIVIVFAPIGVFGLVTPIFLNTGVELIKPLLWFVVTILCGFALYYFVFLFLLLKFVGKIKPWAHYKAMLPVTLMAFSTASSAAVLPFALERVENVSKVSPKTARFTLPLGITINMSGTALYECVVVLFIAQLYQVAWGIQFDIFDQLTVVLMSLLTSVGVAGIPASGLIAITMILSSVGLPVESVSVIWVVERFLDMLRTAINVFNDTCGTIIIARSEGEDTAYPEC
ncbi:MAG: dicarboxylate/amino acid:cation symporter [Puniceicoccales bacterium]|jgi:Na+/H+-dicarboxylate symporter|nr:dicarboxylate/amino acid:cation symporter [Puniceicoccales bacterium]